MATGSGRSDTLSALVTREVRWFQEGPLPAEVLDWFSRSTTPRTERRVDLYDARAADHGIGRKQRDTSTIDSKVRVSVTEDVLLAPRLTGHVEDWLKISRPTGSVTRGISDPLEVEKHLHTRTFSLNGSEDIGCEVELAEIKVGPVRAWSLCFETFGPQEHREDALRAGLEKFISETPLPEAIDLGAESCFAYPEWIARLGGETAVAV